MNTIETAVLKRKKRWAVENRAWAAGIIPGFSSNEELERFLERVNQNPKLADALKRVMAANNVAACQLSCQLSMAPVYRKSRVEENGLITIDAGTKDEEIIKFLLG